MNEAVKLCGQSLLVMGMLWMLSPCSAEKPKKTAPSGQQLFKQHCESCHPGGGNRIKPGLELAESKQLDNIITFKDYLRRPPGHMPYYQNIVSNKDTLNALYKYCKQLKRPIKQV